ncbi:MAG: hypothetical protein ACRC2I_12780 [Plesiomonas shigelloides]
MCKTHIRGYDLAAEVSLWWLYSGFFISGSPVEMLLAEQIIAPCKPAMG